MLFRSGMSDIGRYLDCPREAIFTKLNPSYNSLSEQLALQRGHWFEEGVGNVFKSLGMRLLPQLEIDCRPDGIPLKAHIDFALVWDKPTLAVRVLEVKSMSVLPDAPYSAHEAQVGGQTSLLHEYWQNPVFSLRDSKGCILDTHLTFPEICNRHLGIRLPEKPEDVSIEGWLLCLSMKDATAFGPYNYDKDLLQTILQNAATFWTQLQDVQRGLLSLEELSYAQGFHPLCQYCKANADCPKFKVGSFDSSWEAILSILDEHKQVRSGLDTRIKEIEAVIKNVCILSGNSDWIDTGGHRFRLTQTKGRRILDRDLLHDQLADLFHGLGIEDMDVDGFIASCEKESDPSSRLTINQIR